MGRKNTDRPFERSLDKLIYDGDQIMHSGQESVSFFSSAIEFSDESDNEDAKHNSEDFTSPVLNCEANKRNIDRVQICFDSLNIWT